MVDGNISQYWDACLSAESRNAKAVVMHLSKACSLPLTTYVLDSHRFGLRSKHGVSSVRNVM